ncbi:DUF3348 domain-containing protein [Luteimonas marina]|uniref:DUF3348 domain-containing protein n=1 Tax=Luteimonas marina TaxID=488485 RepID=A0A5C5TXY1_9GAMM|nr:DUF3348 domain-containing protein [Luteimonas marina]TWT18145.1 DUF3348 domain-containing protein [Luteimonas marina]
MEAALHRTPVRGPTFIRLLARLTDADLPSSGPAPADQLGQWIDWTRAVALSRALDHAPDTDATQPGDTPDADADDAAACARARARLATAIAAGDDAGDASDFEPFRRHCVQHQRAMQAAAGRLRGQLRDRLAAASPAMARLAEVDAAMELALVPREQALLAAVPMMLGARFERLRRTAGDGADDLLPPAAPGWRTTFRNDMRHVLLAELDLRFHPIEGLLAALRNR